MNGKYGYSFTKLEDKFIIKIFMYVVPNYFNKYKDRSKPILTIISEPEYEFDMIDIAIIIVKSLNDKSMNLPAEKTINYRQAKTIINIGK